MAHPSFIHLHNHTEYSLLDGASRIPAMVKRAAELEMPALALTDHGVMYGAIQFYRACRQAGINPILGCEVYVAPRSRHQKEAKADRDPYHLTLLAADATGYLNLMRLCTAGQLEGLYYKPRIDRDILAAHAQGLVALSGCLAGEVASRITAGEPELAREAVAFHRDVFGPDRYLLEVQRHGIDIQDKVTQALTSLSSEFGLRLVATNDLHYVHREDADAHDVLLCLQTGARHGDPSRWRFDSEDFYLKSSEEMAALFADLPQAIASTGEVAAQCRLEIPVGEPLLPPFPLPEGTTAAQHLRRTAADGLVWRYGEQPSAAHRDRLETELTVIEQTGFASYFLIVWDFMRFARENGIVVGPGRGSAAGSLVAYCLGITNLDPLAHGLIFERFLNRDRVSMPDIDCDFSVEGRERVIRYVAEKYGADHVAQIITFTTMASKAAIRDVGRVLEIPLRECDRLAKLIPVWQGRSKSLDDAVKEVPEFRESYEGSPELQKLVDVARTLEGVSRNVSTHAAGVVIAPEPLVNYTPLQFGPGREAVITQYDMKAVQDIGLLKMDFLGLQNLDIISTCLRLIKQRRGEEVDIERIPFDDKKTFDLISAADTHGIFQLESAGMRRLLLDMKPQSFEDVTAAVALFRPGPMINIPAYVARKQGREPIEYMHDRLEPILRETYGVMIYQEQVMMSARELAGFSMSEADILRAAMGKKDKAKMATLREKFVSGAVERGIPEVTAADLFEGISKFAAYGFNKSHSAAYAVISYQTAYLKANYQLEYMTSLLIHMEGNADRVATAIVDCVGHGIDVLPPDVNRSQADFSIVDGNVQFGLAAIKNVGARAAELIVEERERGGGFETRQALFDRLAGLHDVNSRVLDSLIRCGACESIDERNRMLFNLDRAWEGAVRKRRDLEAGQDSLFGLEDAGDDVPASLPAMDAEEKLRWEKELLGLYLSDHPLKRIEAELAKLIDTPSVELTSNLQDTEVRVGGLVREVRRVVTRKGQIMAYAELEDLTGSFDVVLFPRTYEQFRQLFQVDAVVVVAGKVDARAGSTRFSSGAPAPEVEEMEPDAAEKASVVADSAWTWDDPACLPVQRRQLVHVTLDTEDPTLVDQLARVLEKHPGIDDVFLHFMVSGREVVVQPGERFHVAAGPALAAEVDSLFARPVTRLETVRPKVESNGNGRGNGRR